MNLIGDITIAIGFGRTQLGKPYDHQHNARFGPDKYDCSGFVSRCLWEGGMPHGNEGLGDNSATMAQWAEAHPDRNIGVPAAKQTLGALLIAGGVTGYGDDGHVAFSLGDGHTLESNGARGVCVDIANRMAWSHGVLAPTNYGDDDLDAEAKQMIKDMHGYLMAGKDPGNQPMIVDVYNAVFDGRTPSILADINQRLIDLQGRAPGDAGDASTVLTDIRTQVATLSKHLGVGT